MTARFGERDLTQLNSTCFDRGAHGRMRRPMRASSRASSEGQATSVEAEDSNAAQGIVADASDERDGGGLSPVGAILQSTLR